MIGPQKARRLAELVRGKKPKRVVECGTAIGYSGLWICARVKGRWARASSSPSRSTRSVPARPRRTSRRRVGGLRGGQGRDAREVVKGLDGPVDFLFIDCNFGNYEPCFLGVEPKLADGAVVVADNVGIGAGAMAGYLKRVRSGHESRTEWFDLDLPWEKRDAMEITNHHRPR